MRTVVGCCGLGVLALVVACNDANFKGTSPKREAVLTREYSQDAYPAAKASFVQGHLGTPQLENFSQGEWGALDLLVVVDNSASMREEQQNLATKLQPLLSKVETSDWQIKVVTTDQADGCDGALIKKGDVDAAQRFEQAVLQAGVRGDGTERGIAQAVLGLQCPQQPWVRQDSTIAVLVLTDEDNCHIGNFDDGNYGCQGEPGRAGEHLTDYLSTIRTIGKDARVYGLLWHPTATQDQCTTALNRGHEYAKVIEATQGKFGSICEADYTATLEAISADVAQAIDYEFELKDNPDDGSLEVLVDGQPWSKFEVVGKVVKFTEVPPLGSKVEVGYRYGREGDLRTEFELEKPAVEGSIKVLVDGEELPADQISYDAEAGVVRLEEAPSERAKVDIQYQERVELNDSYDIGKGFDPATVQVWVNDQPAKASYDAGTGKVKVSPTPAAEAKVKIAYHAAK